MTNFEHSLKDLIDLKINELEKNIKKVCKIDKTTFLSLLLEYDEYFITTKEKLKSYVDSNKNKLVTLTDEEYLEYFETDLDYTNEQILKRYTKGDK